MNWCTIASIFLGWLSRPWCGSWHNSGLRCKQRRVFAHLPSFTRPTPGLLQQTGSKRPPLRPRFKLVIAGSV
jgi:hypothetical protein